MEEGRLDFYDNYDDIAQVIQEVFELNPHSVHTLNKHKEGIYAIALDNLNIVYTMDQSKTRIEIVKVLFSDASRNSLDPHEQQVAAPSSKLRTKQWLEKMSEIMDLRGIKVEESKGAMGEDDSEGDGERESEVAVGKKMAGF